MLKVIFGALALAFLAIPCLAEEPSDNTWLPFSKEYSFAAEILTREKGLQYWAMPMPEDKEGINAARAMISEMQSVTHRENPFILPFVLSGIRYDYNDGRSLAEDSFIEEVENGLETLGKEKLAFIRCTGRYMNQNVPFCFADYEHGQSFQQVLLSKGYVTLSENPVEVPEGFYPVLKETEAKAQKAEIGIWVPFYFMLKGF